MEKESKLSTSKLFHYTDRKENLIKILKEGFHPNYSLEKLGILKKKDFFMAISSLLAKPIPEEDIADEFAIPMCCFCDIPLELVEDHIKLYGNFAIGMKKEWGERQAICPVIYVPEAGESRFLFEMILRYTHKLLPLLKERQIRIGAIPIRKRNITNELLGARLIDYFEKVITLFMYVKPYIGKYERLRVSFKEDNYKFYDEREWRYKPSKFLALEFLTKEEYDDKDYLKKMNDSLGNISFKKEDITDLIAPASEVESLRKELAKIERLKDIDLKLVDTIENKIRI
jgi:hypothetical protein